MEYSFCSFCRICLKKIELDQLYTGLDEQAATSFVEFWADIRQFLPKVCAEDVQIEAYTQELARNLAEENIVMNPEIRFAMAEFGARVACISPKLLKLGFARPHWWMRYASWSEFLKKGRLAESFFNLWSILHFHIPLAELTQRVIDGDHKLYTKLFRFEGNGVLQHNNHSEEILKSFADGATQIVGRALLLRGEPQGHQLRLRMTLFFGWEFGLADLSINELHRFLIEMHVIPESYDPETLRKFRDRMRQLIEKSSNASVLQPSS